ncbi:Kinase superfamily protein [Rhynchospora pubera]|uniref:non-specific serine/threonine protein kinase n=1 Tax=Rhynchospora pubera TaxID=906938 RepID=A0AAV8HT88_9POAL|nr:Kinase superfamily protein [Rhynchospora pubera]
MKCFSCFSSSKKKDERNAATTSAGTNTDGSSSTYASALSGPPENPVENSPLLKQFSYQELVVATNNFTDVIGEGGFGIVYKGILERTRQEIAVKKLKVNLMGEQGKNEFNAEVMFLGRLYHRNLINLIGSCAYGEQRLIVYEFMPQGSLKDHLFDLKPGQQPLDWYTRMRIAFGVAEGLEYLHVKVEPAVIFRDLKPSNILLDENFNSKLSDFGLARLGPEGDETHVTTQVRGTHGYHAPEYLATGRLKVKSDVYTFGVVLLELISGKRAIDHVKEANDPNLVTWGKRIFKDKSNHLQLIDPLLQDNFSPHGFIGAVALAEACLAEDVSARPIMTDVVMALGPLAVRPNQNRSSMRLPPLPDEMNKPEDASTS